MCTTIFERAAVSGSGKGPDGWFSVDRANISYDHPFHAQMEHALTVDFVNEEMGTAARVAVELSRESARELAERILTALDEADVYEGVAVAR